jgi:hypothetical protein
MKSRPEFRIPLRNSTPAHLFRARATSRRWTPRCRLPRSVIPHVEIDARSGAGSIAPDVQNIPPCVRGLLHDAPHHVFVKQWRVAAAIGVLECPARDDERHRQPQERGELRIRRLGTPAPEDLVGRHAQPKQRVPCPRHSARAAHPLSHGEPNRSDLLRCQAPLAHWPLDYSNRHNGYTIPRIPAGVKSSGLAS